MAFERRSVRRNRGLEGQAVSEVIPEVPTSPGSRGLGRVKLLWPRKPLRPFTRPSNPPVERKTQMELQDIKPQTTKPPNVWNHDLKWIWMPLMLERTAERGVSPFDANMARTPITAWPCTVTASD